MLKMKKRKPLKRVNNHEWLAGVCGGIAYAYGLPVVGVRIFFILFMFVLTNPWTYYIGQTLFWFYILFWFLGPEWSSDPEDYDERTA